MTSPDPLALTLPSGEHFRFERSARSGGRFVFVWTLDAGRRGPGPHLHPFEHETFEILSGTLRVWIGGRPRDLAAGDTLVIPPGTPHRFLNPAEEQVVARVTLDGARMEDQLIPLATYLHGRRPTLRDLPTVLLHISKAVRDGAMHPHPRAGKLIFVAFRIAGFLGGRPLPRVENFEKGGMGVAPGPV
jgi:mannose-6-phosphate isomerase-like protein (cupin superfamily)